MQATQANGFGPARLARPSHPETHKFRRVAILVSGFVLTFSLVGGATVRGQGANATSELKSTQQTAASPSRGDAANGKRLYFRDGCWECHGTVGQGGAGARLAPKPPSVVALIAYVRRPAGRMPPYTSKVLSDSDLTDIRAFLATIPPPPSLNNIPMLNQ
ncbi:MAG TPA: cytochrome c [Bryobacteraceae bacterium]|jgi:mono/diheme cytochrome c family protein|nr:cytochrome c [Bryobacteraceae bacterium]